MAAGLGFKTFTTGEVLTAGDVNGYLMQGINVFATTTARNAAITAPAEGQFAFTKDTNSLWYYDGAAWVASGATGDIEGVTAGVGISGGGTSGTVTITNSMATAIDAKGDLVVGTGADTFSRIGVGANGTVLTADSVEATGLKWVAASSGALTKITSAAFSSAATVDVDNVFTTTYTTYMAVIKARGTSGAQLELQFRYGGSVQTSENYGSGFRQTRGNAKGDFGWATPSPNVIDAQMDNGDNNCFTLYFQQVGNSSQRPMLYGNGISVPNQALTQMAGYNDTARTYDGFRLKSNSGNITGTYAVYGVQN
jgi:hypothetical protein